MAALGMIEVYSYTTSIVIADAVAKAADVKVVAIDKNKPANAETCEVPLVMVVKFQGDVGAVNSAHDLGVELAKSRGHYITSRVIGGLDPQAKWFADLTATGKDKLRNMEVAPAVAIQTETAPVEETTSKVAPKKAPAKKVATKKEETK